MTRWLGVLLALIFSSMAFGRVPDIEDLIGLEAIGEARTSPDGKWIAYTVAAADFDEDAYVSQIWLVDLSGNPFPLTRGSKSSTRPRWSPDGKWLSASSRVVIRRVLTWVEGSSGSGTSAWTAEKCSVHGFDPLVTKSAWAKRSSQSWMAPAISG